MKRPILGDNLFLLSLTVALFCLIVTLLLAALLIEAVHAQKKLTAAEAKDHIGETATVCGSVVSTRYAASTKGQPTFLNLDKPYPNQIFTIVIWGSNRSRFGRPEVEYNQKRICVSGNLVCSEACLELLPMILGRSQLSQRVEYVTYLDLLYGCPNGIIPP